MSIHHKKIILLIVFILGGMLFFLHATVLKNQDVGDGAGNEKTQEGDSAKDPVINNGVGEDNGGGFTDIGKGGHIAVADFDDLESLEKLFGETGAFSRVQLWEPDGDNEFVISPDKMSVSSTHGSNVIELSEARAVSGTKSVKMTAAPSGKVVSKTGLVVTGLSFAPGDEFWFSAYFFVETSGSIQNLFLADLEATQVGAALGRRLAITGSDIESLMVESKGRGERAGPSVRQENPIAFPTGRFVKVTWYMKVSKNDDGIIKLWQDDQILIHKTGKNFPPEDTVYDRLQVGITANSTNHPLTLYIDDIVLSKAPLK